MENTETTPIWMKDQKCKDKVKALLMVLNHYTLDPVFLNYGGFYSKIEARNHSPQYRTEATKKEVEGFYKFSGNFFDLSYYFDIETNDKAVIETLKAAIDKNKNSPEFKKAFYERFNAIKFTKTMYLNEIEVKKYMRFSGEWWITHEIGEPIDIKDIDKAPAILEALKVEELKGTNKIKDKNPEFRIEYFERHYTSDEWNEIRDLTDAHETVSHQFIRKTEIEKDDMRDYKEYTLKSTGRKFLAHFTKYHMIYKDL